MVRFRPRAPFQDFLLNLPRTKILQRFAEFDALHSVCTEFALQTPVSAAVWGTLDCRKSIFFKTLTETEGRARCFWSPPDRARRFAPAFPASGGCLLRAVRSCAHEPWQQARFAFLRCDPESGRSLFQLGDGLRERLPTVRRCSARCAHARASKTGGHRDGSAPALRHDRATAPMRRARRPESSRG